MSRSPFFFFWSLDLSLGILKVKSLGLAEKNASLAISQSCAYHLTVQFVTKKTEQAKEVIFM